MLLFQFTDLGELYKLEEAVFFCLSGAVSVVAGLVFVGGCRLAQVRLGLARNG